MEIGMRTVLGMTVVLTATALIGEDGKDSTAKWVNGLVIATFAGYGCGALIFWLGRAI